MSTDTRQVVKVGNPTATQEAESATESRADKKARIARVLDRGVGVDRLNVETLPSHLHGEWVPNDPKEILDKENLGFRIDTEYAKQRKLHGTADGRPIIGDCVYMVCERETKEIIDEIRNEQYLRANRKQGPQKEEKDFASQTSKLGEIPTITEGSVNEARKAELEAAMGITKD